MEITINDSIKIKDLQKQFSKYYPYLKIEFFAKPHAELTASPKKEILNRELTLREARTSHNNGMLVIHPNQRISELEHNFQAVFGLPVQVFRKAGKAWIETTKTDHRTIREQNKFARLQNETTESPSRLSILRRIKRLTFRVTSPGNRAFLLWGINLVLPR